jgi:GcrA cell cycle regulator
MAWTDESVEILRTMWLEGRSAREIGDRLGMTRNAVIGKANRLGLSHKSKTTPPRPAVPTEVKNRAMSPLDLNERMCRWPIGHPGDADFHFCGSSRIPGRPYCEDHCAVAYRGRAVEAAA